jgi:hypothetical protein
VTRENYLALNFLGTAHSPDEPLDGELEAEMPRELRQGWDDDDE